MFFRALIIIRCGDGCGGDNDDASHQMMMMVVMVTTIACICSLIMCLCC